MMNPLDLERTVVVASKSRYELVLEEVAGDMTKIKNRFPSEKVWRNITEGHLAQKTNLPRVTELFPPEQIIFDRAELTTERIKAAQTFIFLGGDNHFTFCAQEILNYQRQHPEETKNVCGVVLDPKKSTGALLDFNVDTLLAQWNDIVKGKYRLERWTTLEAHLAGGRPDPYPALCDYFIGENRRPPMSRNLVYIDDQLTVLPEKSSGLLVVCGCGTAKGSWYDNAHGSMFDEDDTLSREAEEFRLIVTENREFRRIISGANYNHRFTLRPGQKLEIHSFNDDHGVISASSHDEHSVNFSMGNQATVGLSPYKLRVITPEAR